MDKGQSPTVSKLIDLSCQSLQTEGWMEGRTDGQKDQGPDAGQQVITLAQLELTGHKHK